MSARKLITVVGFVLLGLASLSASRRGAFDEATYWLLLAWMMIWIFELGGKR